ncbi:MAG: hypothetical protein M3Q48_04405, partial [Actinomycetota bacterium]|nr:hypothetical protein [Actinomycetota bacterium]
MGDAVPEPLRPAIRGLLDDLVAGRYAEMLTLVREYGSHGTTLVRQPEEMWTHRYTSVVRQHDGGWSVVL